MAASLSQPPPSSASCTIWSVPYGRNPYFTGRQRELEQIHQNLESPDPARRTQVICGPAGIGKTQLALEHCWRHRDRYSIIWWVRAGEPNILINDFLKLGVQMSPSAAANASPEMQADAIRRELDRRGNWLLVLDDAQGPGAVSHVVPQGGSGRVLITSRNPNWREVATHLPLEKWYRDDSVRFLCNRTGIADIDPAAAQLAEALGDLPLALELAGAYIAQLRIGFAAYLDRCRVHQQKHPHDQRSSSDCPDAVLTTWTIASDQVRGDSRAAGDLMNLCAFLCPDEIRRDMLSRGAAVLPGPLAATVGDQVKLNEAVAILRGYSLIDANQAALSIHRLVAAVTLQGLADEDRRRWAEVAIRVISDAFAFQSANVSTWQLCPVLLPHVGTVTAHAETLDVAGALTAELLNDAGHYLLRTGHFAKSKEYLDRSLALARRTWGDKHPSVSAIVNNLGRVCARLGNLTDARQYFEWALGIDEPIYGHDHPHVATIVNNYGLCLMAAGDTANARKHFEWALAVYEKRFGPKSAKTASTANNLGYATLRLGDVHAARSHFERALTIAESTVGPNHPTVASILHNLALALKMSGELQAARNYMERAISIDRATYAPTHPDVIRDVDSLGEILKELGDTPALRAHYAEALEAVVKLHGTEHARAKQLRKMLAELGG